MSLQSGDHTCSISSRQVRTLLALLALSPGRVLSTDWLVAALWDEATIANSRNALQATVTRLRRHLRGFSGTLPLLRTSYGGYVLDVTPLDVDAFQFTAMLDRASALRHEEPTEALRLTHAALALWRGPALEGVNDLSALRAEQARLEEGHVGALEMSAELRLELGDTRTVLNDLRHLVEIHADRERLGELLMVALYRNGQQSEALDVFNRIRVRLRHELGIDPGRGLRYLQQAILSQDPTLELSSGLDTLRRLSGGRAPHAALTF
ncbi:BTAD domain-containing putative transcriptional regulator [Cellulomonas sp. 179-A 4D5 NHS]|uniref:AfsR/SARP family transcriptional regulator n=1 Tax=Cellulomonas sp. 179-A 4D5 NHS TaxID=3142378 RepID=UPI0039A203BD